MIMKFPPQSNVYLSSLSRCLLLNQTLPSPSKPLKLTTTSILLALLLKTHLVPLPNLPPYLLHSPPLSHSLFNPIISSFSRSNFPSLALQTFSLLHRLSLPLDSYSLCSSLSALAASNSSYFYKPGNQIHAAALKSAYFPTNIFVCGALIEFYAKTHDVEDAQQVFDEIPVKNVVCANSLLNGFSERRLWMGGIDLFRRMRSLGLEPDEVTLCGILRICAEAAVIGLGLQVHAYLMRRVGYGESDVILLGSLVEMYGKCGLVSKAQLVFDKLTGGKMKNERDVMLWTSMLTVYGRNGMFDDVIRTFERMLIEKTEPDEVVFLAVLSACGRSGNVAKGLEFFEIMGRDYALVPGSEHYGCVVDMLCRAGELESAWRFVNEMGGNGSSRGGIELGVSIWGAILSACRDCGNVKIGKAAASKALELDPHNVGIYMELSNLYAGLGMWNEIGKLRELMKERGLKKHVGFSWLECMN